MSDVNETLADWRKTMYAYDKLGVHAGGALLAAVENVLALCDRVEATDFRGMTALYTDSIRKAITDGLGATDE